MQHRIVDTQHQGMIVGVFEHPDAWTAESTVVWNYRRPTSHTGNRHYEHGHHQWVWTDGQGGWIPTNDPNFDPNVGSSRAWTLAKKVRE